MLGLIVLALGSAAAFNLQGIAFGIAALTAETRPALLREAEWGSNGSSVQFKARFAAGSPTRALLDWLGENDFVVDQSKQRAERLIKGVPCQELIDVNWHSDPRGNLIDANVEVADAGCL